MTSTILENSINIKPNEILYFPRHTIHSVINKKNEDSISISWIIRLPTRIDFIKQNIEALLHKFTSTESLYGSIKNEEKDKVLDFLVEMSNHQHFKSLF